ncbi:hypothetical protein ACFY2K_42885 [Kitasatospora sp. NPDC001309]|uniref:hypothetical protein n=1 Tax=Kitasatospora sp. NPDC001309 TaxID=3364013 RepID=UPI0036A0F507
MTYDANSDMVNLTPDHAADSAVHLAHPDAEQAFARFLDEVLAEADHQVNVLTFEDQALTERTASGTRSGARVVYVDGHRHSVHHLRLRNGKRARVLLREDEWETRDVRGLHSAGAFDGSSLVDDGMYQQTAGRDMATIPPRDHTRDRFESAADPWAEILESFKTPGAALGVWA